MEVKTAKNTQLLYIEAMRIFACFFVIYNHLPAFAQFYSAEAIADTSRFAYMMVSAMSKVSVPLFFMISGALLLKKSEALKTLFLKRICKMVFVIFFINLLSYLVFCFCVVREGHDFPFSIYVFVRGMLNNSLPDSLPYWFLYSYVGFLLVLPLLRRIVKGGLKGSEFAIIVACLAFKQCLLPLFNAGLFFLLHKEPLQLFFPVPLLDTQVFFPLAGYYLNEHLDLSKFRAKHAWGILGLMTAGCFFACLLTYYGKAVSGKFSQTYIASFSWLHAIGIFILAKYLVDIRFKKFFVGKPGNFLSFAGSLTFGIYLMDPLLKSLIYPYFSRISLYEHSSPFISSVAWCLFSLVLGGALTWLLKKAPLLRRVL